MFFLNTNINNSNVLLKTMREMPKEGNIPTIFSALSRNSAGFALGQCPNQALLSQRFYGERGISLLNTNQGRSITVPRSAFHQTAFNHAASGAPSNGTPAPFNWKGFIHHFKTNMRASLPGTIVGGILAGMVAGYLGGLADEKKAKLESESPKN